MSKEDKGYDPALLRCAGNILSQTYDKHTLQSFGINGITQTEKEIVTGALALASEIRRQAKKLEKLEQK